MRNKLILLLVIVLGIGIIAFISLKFSNQAKTLTQIQQKSNNSASYQSQTNEKGSVIVEVTPLLLTSGKDASFTVTFTTHSGDLNYDIAAISKLTDNKGKEYDPISWTGGKGGHHLEGTLIFSKLSQDASSVTLTIPGIDNQDRIFKWRLD